MSVSAFDLFKIGIGPSSSHTVGPMNAAHRFARLLDTSGVLEDTHKIRVDLYGSLGLTGRGHATPSAIILGLQGESPEFVDVDAIPKVLTSVRESGRLSVLGKASIAFDAERDLKLHRRRSLPFHPNAMTFVGLNERQETVLERTYYSVGAGFVVDHACDEKAGSGTKERYLDFPYDSASDLLSLCRSEKLSIAQIALANERSWRTDTETREGLLERWKVMQTCIQRGCRTPGVLPGGLNVPRRAPGIYDVLQDRYPCVPSDPLVVLDWVSLYALAVNEENASGGRVVTAPTNGAAGIIPAVLSYYRHHCDDASDDGVVDFLLTASAIGNLFKANASLSGAEVGCQGEVGAACSMAAGGLTAVLGGTPEQVENAAEIGMEHNLGLTCDPVGGLVQVPCIERNAIAATKAISASRMALRGDGQHIVSLDAVIRTMRDTGRDMHKKYKETSRGGLALSLNHVPVNVIEC